MKYDVSNSPPPQRKDEGKNNPYSLTRILWAMRTQLGESGDSRRVFAEKLSEKRPRFSEKGVTENQIAKIENDETKIYYWHLEAYAELIGVPSGIILLISRIDAKLAIGHNDESAYLEVRSMINSIMKLCEFYLHNEEIFKNHAVQDGLTNKKIRSLFEVYKTGSANPLDMIREIKPLPGSSRSRDMQLSFEF